MKDNFDDILKNKWEQFHFPVDEKHRQDMIALLDNQKRRKGGLIWWWTGIGAIIAGLAIILYLQQSSTAKSSQDQLQPAENSTTTVIAKNDGGTQYHPGITNMDVLKNEIVINSDNVSASDDYTKSNTNANSKPESKKSPQENVNANKGESNNVISRKSENNKTRKAFASKEEISFQKENDQRGKPIPEKNALDTEQQDDQGELPNFASTEPVRLVERNNQITSYLPNLDIRNLEYSANTQIEAKAIAIKKNPVRLFIEAGAGVVSASKPDYTAGWTFNAGGGINYRLSSRSDLVLSGGYLLQNGGFDFQRTSSVVQQSFGSRSSFHTLTPEKLHFVYAKIGLHHYIHRHIISIGGGLQYLYGAQGDIAIQVNDQILGQSIDDSRKNVWLTLDGMQQFLINTEVQYGYRLTRKLSLLGGLRYYLTGIEAKDPELTTRGFYWSGKYSRISPFFTLNYQLYGTR